ncbi:ABC transporter substrate-binding protein [Streptomyces sp. NPDC013953]|uniref:ABC transporter substrate-binding protein n=1 Tax=Streptomyces sp. NPDC013953 TaxID=3364868 RepID=UPI0036FE1A52
MWEFTDDTGQVVRADRRPERTVAYVRAGAALHDLGVRPVAVYGSDHDGDGIDPAKGGALPAAAVPCLGPGGALTDEALSATRPDLIIDVTYDGKSAYAIDEALAGRLGVPLLTLSVGGAPLTAILERFGALAAALGTELPAPGAVTGLPEAEHVLRAALAAAGPPPRVLALSGAGPDRVHLARPDTWPELRHLSGLGVPPLDPGPGPGLNWLTTGWEHVTRLRPGLLLVDSRAHASRPRTVTGAVTVPWNPEAPPSPAAYARFFTAVAEGIAARPA